MAEFSASLMCANLNHLETEVRSLESAGIDSFHVDLMDAVFVPNLGMGLQDLECIEGLTDRPIEIHLMVENVAAYLRVLRGHRISKIYFHPNAVGNAFQMVQSILDMGVEPGIALDPGVSIESVRELLHAAGSVMVLPITPGFAGHPCWPFVTEKVDRLIRMKEEYGFRLYWDGNCTWDRLRTYGGAGVDGFVMGTNVLFRQQDSYENLIRRARALCGEGSGEA